jgi:hypothetical protein
MHDLRCAVCVNKYKNEIEALLLDGVRPMDISKHLAFGTEATGISLDSIYRHRKRHLYPSIDVPIRDTALSNLGLWQHLESALADTAKVSERATAQGNSSLLLKAAQSRTAVVREILDRLPEGEQLDLTQALRDAQGFVTALMRLVRRTPQLGLDIANQLEDDGTAPELRASFRNYATGALALDSKKEI